MESKTNEREDADVKCISDGKLMFLKLGVTAFAALALDSLTAGFIRANDNLYLNLPVAPQNGAVDLSAGQF